jgi:hypothetical protein
MFFRMMRRFKILINSAMLNKRFISFLLFISKLT